MPKAISTLRRYPTTVFLAMLLFLATLAITTGSLGIVRPGGSGGNGSGDGGSGFGGTGRSGDFGGSGLGGTGMPSPFVTVDDSEPEQMLDQPQPAPAESPLVEQITEQSSEQLLAETPLVPEALEPEQEPVADSVKTADTELTVEMAEAPDHIPVETRPIEPSLPAPIQIVEAPKPEAPPADSSAPAVASELATSEAMERATLTEELENAEEMENAQDAPQLVDSVPANLDPGETDELDRNVLPERIQRPELPPFQRIRPIERPAIASPPARL